MARVLSRDWAHGTESRVLTELQDVAREGGLEVALDAGLDMLTDHHSSSSSSQTLSSTTKHSLVVTHYQFVMPSLLILSDNTIVSMLLSMFYPS